MKEYDTERLRRLLGERAERAIPDSLDLWPSVRSGYESRRKAVLRRLIVLPIILAILIALAVLAVTTSWGQGFFSSAGYSYRIAYIGDSPDGSRQLFTVKPDGSGGIQVTDVGLAEESFEWSPDGSRIAFAGRGPDNKDIFVVNPDGSGLTDLSEAFPLNPYYPIPYSYLDRDPTWSPDGSRIAFVRDDRRGIGVYVMNDDGSEKRPAIALSLCDQVKDPKWSPVGSDVLFECDRSEDSWGIFVVDVDTGQVKWSPDGSKLLFTRRFERRRAVVLLGTISYELVQRFRTEARHLKATVPASAVVCSGVREQNVSKNAHWAAVSLFSVAGALPHAKAFAASSALGCFHSLLDAVSADAFHIHIA